MKVTLLAFGKLRTPGLRDAADYYKKLLSTWVTLEELELKPLEVPDKSPATRALIQVREAALLLEKIETRGGIKGLYLLDERGKNEPTRNWAARVREWESQGSQGICIAIGSSLGWSDELRIRARGLLSLGAHTLSHELARTVVLEQLYRSWSVTRGHPYHNEA